MNIISGTAVDLLEPFPLTEAGRVFGWKHCYRTLSDDDDVPVLRELFTASVKAILPTSMSCGVIDKTQMTSAKHEAPLVGLLLFLPQGTRDGALHFASGRKAFRMGLIEEALHQWLPTLFEAQPSLLRVSCLLDEANSPAKSLLKRLGFHFEGIMRGAVLQGGVPRSRVMFSLLRQQLQSSIEDREVPEEVADEPNTSTDPAESIAADAAATIE